MEAHGLMEAARNLQIQAGVQNKYIRSAVHVVEYGAELNAAEIIHDTRRFQRKQTQKDARSAMLNTTLFSDVLKLNNHDNMHTSPSLSAARRQTAANQHDY